MADDDERALLAHVRAFWSAVDPPPADLAERMIAAVSAADLSREYALLTLMEHESPGVVRGSAGTVSVHFADGVVDVLLSISDSAGGARRIDGWVNAEVRDVSVLQGEREVAGVVEAAGRFAIDHVPSGLGLLRLRIVRDDETTEVRTPRFEV